MVDPENAPTPTPEVDPILGGVIQGLREKGGFSISTLESHARLEPGTLARIENGQVDPPWSTIEAIAKGLGVSVQAIACAAEEARLQTAPSG